MQILPISSLSIYEKFDPLRTEILYNKIKKEKIFKDPIVVARLQGKYIVVDGANRLEAVRQNGYEKILANVVDYSDVKQVVLTNNAHFLNIDQKALCDILEKNGIKLHRSDKESAKERLLSGKICGMISHGDIFFELEDFTDLESGIDLLNRLVNSYAGKYDIFRLSELSHDDTNFGTRITFRRFTMEDILQIIKNGSFLNSGITWHQVKNSIIRFNLPLDVLKRKDSGKVLNELITKKISQKGIRYYPSNVYACNDWE